MGFDDANNYLSSKGIKASSFETIGESHEGLLKDVDVQDVTDSKGVPQFRQDGVTPKKQLVITWDTEERDPTIAGDTGKRKLYCSWRLEAAIRAQMRAAGGDGLEPDARLKVTFTGTEKVKGAPQPAKVYDVEYARPAFAASKAPVATGVQESYPEDKVNLARTLADAGQPVELIAQATQLPQAWLVTNVMTI